MEGDVRYVLKLRALVCSYLYLFIRIFFSFFFFLKEKEEKERSIISAKKKLRSSAKSLSFFFIVPQTSFTRGENICYPDAK